MKYLKRSNVANRSFRYTFRRRLLQKSQRIVEILRHTEKSQHNQFKVLQILVIVSSSKRTAYHYWERITILRLWPIKGWQPVLVRSYESCTQSFRSWLKARRYPQETFQKKGWQPTPLGTKITLLKCQRRRGRWIKSSIYWFHII